MKSSSRCSIPVEAVKADAPVLHPGSAVLTKGLPVPVESVSNVFAYLKWGKGDIEEGFRQADLSSRILLRLR